MHIVKFTRLSILISFSFILFHFVPASAYRLLMIGNSHTNSLRPIWPLAHQTGHTDFYKKECYILGAPLIWNYNHPTDNKWDQYLKPDSSWDGLLLLCWDSNDTVYAPKFAQEAYKGNPNCQIFLYTIWPDGKDNWVSPIVTRQESWTEKVSLSIEKAFPTAKKPRVIPSSLLIRELGRMADQSKLPGVADHYQLLSDGGHLSNYGAYAVNALLYQMIFKEGPDRIPSTWWNHNWDDRPIPNSVGISISDSSAKAINATVWDVAGTYAPAAVNIGLAITDRQISQIISGTPFQMQLKTINNTSTVGWGLSMGILPEGITLKSSGLLSGTTTATGQYNITVTASSGAQFTRRNFIISVVPDIPPTITSNNLQSISLNSYFMQALTATGGVGNLNWTIISGELPHGIELKPHGILVGTPGEQGLYSFTVQVQDSNPKGIKTATKAFQWNITGLSSTGLYSLKTADSIKLDGKLDEAFWKNLTPIAKVAKGSPVKNAYFGTAWREKTDQWGNKSQELFLGIKVEDGTIGKTANDFIEIYVDALHNREKVYNADDNRYRFTRAGVQTAFNQVPTWKLWTTSKVYDGGTFYSMELIVPGLYGQHPTETLEPYDVFGVDVAVFEGKADTSVQVWQGSIANAIRTDMFGSIVLYPSSVVGVFGNVNASFEKTVFNPYGYVPFKGKRQFVSDLTSEKVFDLQGRNMKFTKIINQKANKVSKKFFIVNPIK